jgi:hypothetical protein
LFFPSPAFSRLKHGTPIVCQVSFDGQTSSVSKPGIPNLLGCFASYPPSGKTCVTWARQAPCGPSRPGRGMDRTPSVSETSIDPCAVGDGAGRGRERCRPHGRPGPFGQVFRLCSTQAVEMGCSLMGVEALAQPAEDSGRTGRLEGGAGRARVQACGGGFGCPVPGRGRADRRGVGRRRGGGGQGWAARSGMRRV